MSSHTNISQKKEGMVQRRPAPQDDRNSLNVNWQPREVELNQNQMDLSSGLLNQFMKVWCDLILWYASKFEWRDEGFSEFIASDSAGKSNICRKDSHSLGVVGAKVGVFVEVDHSSFTCFLESKQSWSLETMDNFFRLTCQVFDKSFDWISKKLLFRWNGAFWMRRSVVFWYLLI